MKKCTSLVVRARMLAEVSDIDLSFAHPLNKKYILYLYLRNLLLLSGSCHRILWIIDLIQRRDSHNCCQRTGFSGIPSDEKPSGMCSILIKQELNFSVRFQVLIAASMNMAVFWVVAPCSLVEVLRRFRGTCCFHHQGNNGDRMDDGCLIPSFVLVCEKIRIF
jgi:hypothetical protein